MQTTVEALVPSDERPARNPWLLVAFTVVGVVGVTLVVITIVAWLFPTPAKTLAANECRLQDGSILTIEKVDWGQTHSFSYSRWAPRWLIFNELRTLEGRSFHNDENLGIWMTRRDARTGQPMDFNWWSECRTEDAFGNEVHELWASFNEAGHQLRSSGHSRKSYRPHQRADTWFVYSRLPKFHTAGRKFTLKVKNNSDEVVGTIELEHPSPTPDLGWQVDPLPATKTDGDVTVTYKGFSNDANKPQSMFSILNARWGENSADRRFLNYSDQLGREWPTRGRSMDDSIYNERVWKMRVLVHKWPTDVFDANETWNLAPIPIPAANAGAALSESQTINGCKVTLEGIGGSGDVSYAVSGDSIRHRGSSGFVKEGPIYSQEQSYRVELKPEGAAGRVIAIAPSPHLMLRIEGRTPNQVVYVKMKDDLARDVFNVPVEHHNLYLFKPEPDAQSIKLTVIVHTGREFEFFVKPPAKPIVVR